MTNSKKKTQVLTTLSYSSLSSPVSMLDVQLINSVCFYLVNLYLSVYFAGPAIEPKRVRGSYFSSHIGIQLSWWVKKLRVKD